MRLFTNEKTLSTEMIAVQKNDAVITEITGLFQKIIDDQKNYGLNNNKSFFIKKPFKNTLAKLDSIIAKRFGIKVKHIAGDGYGYAVLPNPPINFNVINNDFPVIYETVDQELHMEPGEGGAGDRNTLIENTTSFHNDYFRVMSAWKKSIDSLENQLSTDSVVVDLEKAVIRNLPKKYLIFILVDFKYLIDKILLTAEELTALLLHEIGHAFTHLEYSYRTVNNTSILLDSMQEYIGKKGMSPKKAIALTYQDLGGEEDLNNATTVTAIIRLMDRYQKASLGMTDSSHTYTDSEILADQFSGRFGLSGELASALDKMITERKSLFNTVVYIGATIMYLSMIVVVLMLYGVGFIFALGGLLAIVTSVMVSTSIVTNGGTNGNLIYDTDKQRYQKIKNEMIRQLRTVDLNKKEIKELINTIENISMLIERTPNKSPSITDKIYRLVFSKTSKRYLNLKEMNELIETMQENELYVGSNKLKELA